MSEWFVEDARTLLRHAWSVRLAVLSAVFSGLEIALPYLGGIVPPRVLAALALAAGIGSAVARFVPQPRMRRRAQERQDG